MFKDFTNNLPTSSIMRKTYVRLMPDTGLFDCLYKMLKSNSNEAVIVKDLNSPDELSNVAGIITKSDIGRHIRKDGKQPSAGEVASRRLITVTPDTTAREARDIMLKNSIGRVVVVRGGEIEGILTVTELLNTFYLQIDEIETSLLSIIENVQEAICFIDNKGVVVFWNKASELLYGVPKERILGNPIADVFPTALLLKSLKDKKAYENVKHSPAEGVSAVISTMPIMIDGRFIGVVSTDKDESELTKLSKKLETQKNELNQLKRQVKTMSGSRGGFREIIGKSHKIMEAITLAQQIAKTHANILITGESGTGKEVFAKAIHRESGRTGGFIPINCSAIPSALLESEMFGYEAGSFTGALKTGREGKFELADKGTLFLDEIGDMPLEMQAKLLRVLQDGVVTRVGGSRQLALDVRIICATNRDLKELMKKGEFREDLFYRINVLTVCLPPLRERREDVPLLVTEFVKEFASENNVDPVRITPEAMECISSQNWSGNIRELRNTIERLVILCQSGTIEKSDLPREMLIVDLPRSAGFDIVNGEFHLENAVADFEKSSILGALAAAKGNKAKAASLLHINRTSLYYKMKLYGIGV